MRVAEIDVQRALDSFGSANLFLAHRVIGPFRFDVLVIAGVLHLPFDRAAVADAGARIVRVEERLIGSRMQLAIHDRVRRRSRVIVVAAQQRVSAARALNRGEASEENAAAVFELDAADLDVLRLVWQRGIDVDVILARRESRWLVIVKDLPAIGEADFVVEAGSLRCLPIIDAAGKGRD